MRPSKQTKMTIATAIDALIELLNEIEGDRDLEPEAEDTSEENTAAEDKISELWE